MVTFTTFRNRTVTNAANAASIWLSAVADVSMLWLHLIAAIFAVIDYVPPAYSMNGDVLQWQTVRIAVSSRVPNALPIVIIAVKTSALHVRMHMLAPRASKNHADIVFFLYLLRGSDMWWMWSRLLLSGESMQYLRWSGVRQLTQLLRLFHETLSKLRRIGLLPMHLFLWTMRGGEVHCMREPVSLYQLLSKMVRWNRKWIKILLGFWEQFSGWRVRDRKVHYKLYALQHGAEKVVMCAVAAMSGFTRPSHDEWTGDPSLTFVTR